MRSDGRRSIFYINIHNIDNNMLQQQQKQQTPRHDQNPQRRLDAHTHDNSH